MHYTFVGTHPEFLASGRPLAFGDQVDAQDLVAEDKRLAPLLIAESTESTSTPPTSEAT